MSLNETSIFDIAKRQFYFKLHANASVFTVLFILQIISTIFLLGSGSSGNFNHSNDSISLTWSSFSNDGIVGLTLFWAIVVGFLCTSTAQRNESFAFVSNRFTYHLANLYFLCFAAIIGGVTTVLLGSATKLYALLRYDHVIIATSGLLNAPGDFFSRFLVMTAYTLLVSILCYTVGMLIQLSRLFIMLLAALFIGLRLFIGLNLSSLSTEKIDLVGFITDEQSTILFIVKIVLIVAALFFFSVWSTNRIEVRK